MRQITVWLLSVAVLSGCTTMKPVRVELPERAPFGRVMAGDTVVVSTKDGRTDRFIVAEIVGDTIVSKNGGRYSATEIVRLERKSVHVGRTVALGAGIFFTCVIVMLAVAVGSFLGSY